MKGKLATFSWTLLNVLELMKCLNISANVGASHYMISVMYPFLSQEQYTLCFELLQAYLDSFDTYANFKAL